MEKTIDKVKSFKNAGAIVALAFTFILYVLSFEPFALAELAYVFAVPAIFACRYIFAKNNFKYAYKIWIFYSFLFCYLSWVVILIWLRFVYPPAGWVVVFVLPFAISAFVGLWFALLPFLLPKENERLLFSIIKGLSLPALWVILEWLRSFMFTGFPWCLLADSQWQKIAIIQVCSVGGVWILSFVLIYFNLAVAQYLYKIFLYHKAKLKNNTHKISKFTPELYIAISFVFGCVWCYIWQLPSKENQIDTFKVGMVQTDFAGILKWDKTNAYENLKVVENLTLALKDFDVDLVIWPEAATPPCWPVIGDDNLKKFIEEIAKKMNVPILMGNMAYISYENLFQNGAFVVSEKYGLDRKYYAKQKLVPFGEYTPKWASFLGKIVPVGNMNAGTANTLLDIIIKDKSYKVGTMICYEDIFPSLGRQMALEGSDIFFVCTNDSWYGREAGAWQHASSSALQAVANRKPLLRSSNNGLSALFDQYGRMQYTKVIKDTNDNVWNADDVSMPIKKDLELYDVAGNPLNPKTFKAQLGSAMMDNNGSIYFRGVGFANISFYKNFIGTETFYTKYGDWFVYLCIIFLGLAVVIRYFEITHKK